MLVYRPIRGQIFGGLGRSSTITTPLAIALSDHDIGRRDGEAVESVSTFPNLSGDTLLNLSCLFRDIAMFLEYGFVICHSLAMLILTNINMFMLSWTWSKDLVDPTPIYSGTAPDKTKQLYIVPVKFWSSKSGTLNNYSVESRSIGFICWISENG